jgi:hypothetical protein
MVTIIPLDRMESERSALSLCIPNLLNVIVARPTVFVFTPPTIAPSIGSPVSPSVTITLIGSPILILFCDVSSLRICALLKASKAKRSFSPSLTLC